MPSAAQELLLLGDEVALSYDQRAIAIPNLFAYHKLDETSGNAADSSGNGYTGTATGVTWNDTAPPISGLGNAPKFNGTTSTIDFFSAGLASAFSKDAHTVAVWYKPDTGVLSDGTNRMLFGITAASVPNGSINIFKKDSPNNTFQFGAAAAGTAGTIDHTNSSTGWNHVALTVSGATCTPYINGAAQTGFSRGVSWSAALTTAQIGTRGGAFFWKGWLWRFAIYSRALTAAEVLTLATAV